MLDDYIIESVSSQHQRALESKANGQVRRQTHGLIT